MTPNAGGAHVQAWHGWGITTLVGHVFLWHKACSLTQAGPSQARVGGTTGWVDLQPTCRPQAPLWGSASVRRRWAAPRLSRGKALCSQPSCVRGDCERVFLRACVFLETKTISIHEVRTSEPRATPSTEDEQDLRTWGQGTRPGPSGN